MTILALPPAERRAYHRRAQDRWLSRGDNAVRKRAQDIERKRRLPKCRRVSQTLARRYPWLGPRGFMFVLVKWHERTKRQITTFANERTARAWCTRHCVAMP